MCFPWWTFNPQNSASLAIRWSTIAKYILNRDGFLRFEHRPLDGRFSFATIVRKEDLKMSGISLKSCNKHGTTAPKLIVGCDDSVSVQTASAFYRSWPGGVDAFAISDVAQWHRHKGDEIMARFCEAHVFGFKHCLCLMALEMNRQPVLYSDSDVLWFRDPAQLVAKYCSQSVFGSIDCGLSYNHSLLADFPEYKALLADGCGINAGFAIFNDCPKYGPQEVSFIQRVLEQKPAHFFSEQTLLAILTKKQGGVIAEDDVVISESRSLFPSWISKKWYARHYVSSVREQIWSDAIFL
jgi:hypothetical protein